MTGLKRLAVVVLTAVCVGPLAVFAVAKGCVALDGSRLGVGETVVVWTQDANAKPHGGYWAGQWVVVEVLPGERLKVRSTADGAVRTVRLSEVQGIDRWGGDL